MRRLAFSALAAVFVVGCSATKAGGPLRLSAVAPTNIQARLSANAGMFTTYQIPSGALPFGIVRGSDGNMWFTEGPSNGNIGRVTPNGVVTEFPVPNNWDGECIVRGRGHDLWFAANQSQIIGKIMTSGQVSTYKFRGIAPDCVALGSDGNVWFTDTWNRAMGRLQPRTGQIVEYKLGGPYNVPLNDVEGPDGNIWFTDNGAGEVGKITPAGAITEYPLPSGSNCRPYGIVAAPDGALYVGELATTKIARVATDGVITEYGLGSVSAASELAIGPDKQIWFSTRTTIMRYVIGTRSVQRVAEVPNGASAVTLAAGPDRDIWFTATGGESNQIYVGLFEK